MNIQRKISNYNFSSRNGNSIKYIVLHYTGNKGDTAKNNVDYFYGGDRSASAHYFVDDTSIWQCVEESNSAWAVGDGKGAYGITNSNSISIEMCCDKNGEISAITEGKAIELVKSLMSKYNIFVDNVVRHYDASRKICPNWSANNWGRWLNFKKKLGDSTIVENIVVTKPTTSVVDYSKYANYVGNRCKELQTLLIALGYNCGGYGVDGIFGKGTYDSLIQFQKDYGLKVDGLAGHNTFDKLYELTGTNDSNISFDFEQWVRDLQLECNRQGFSNQKIDGYPGLNTLKGCPTLRKGVSGNITKLVQERLISLGYKLVKYGADSDFGSETYEAVVKFQKDYGLSPDGIVGKSTWKKLLGM